MDQNTRRVTLYNLIVQELLQCYIPEQLTGYITFDLTVTQQYIQKHIYTDAFSLFNILTIYV